MAERTLEEMATEGERKLREKTDDMTTMWYNRTDDMKDAYGNLPFGDTIKRHYNSGIDAAVKGKAYHVEPEKWRRKWTSKMSV